MNTCGGTLAGYSTNYNETMKTKFEVGLDRIWYPSNGILSASTGSSSINFPSSGSLEITICTIVMEYFIWRELYSITTFGSHNLDYGIQSFLLLTL